MPDGSVQQTRQAATRKERITAEDAGDPVALATILSRSLETLDTAAKAASRQYIDFEDVACTSGTDVRLNHNLNTRVRWWLVDWAGSAAPNLRKATSTTPNILMLTCGQTGTATVRVEPV